MKKVIIVTGASSGIGKATALQLLKEGHTVYGAARRMDKMNELVSAGGEAIAIDVINNPYKEMKHLIARMMENTNNPGQYSECSK